jgi:hypothetical protein
MLNLNDIAINKQVGKLIHRCFCILFQTDSPPTMKNHPHPHYRKCRMNLQEITAPDDCVLYSNRVIERGLRG